MAYFFLDLFKVKTSWVVFANKMPEYWIFLLGQKSLFSLSIAVWYTLVSVVLHTSCRKCKQANKHHKCKILSFLGVANIFLGKATYKVVEMLSKNPALHHWRQFSCLHCGTEHNSTLWGCTLTTMQLLPSLQVLNGYFYPIFSTWLMHPSQTLCPFLRTLVRHRSLLWRRRGSQNSTHVEVQLTHHPSAGVAGQVAEQDIAQIKLQGKRSRFRVI